MFNRNRPVGVSGVVVGRKREPSHTRSRQLLAYLAAAATHFLHGHFGGSHCLCNVPEFGASCEPVSVFALLKNLFGDEQTCTSERE